MAYTGIPPAQLKRIQPADVSWQEPSVLVRGRKKGGGVRPVRLPLTPRGLEAFRALEAAEAWGPFSTSSAGKVFKRAIAAMCTALEEHEATRALAEPLRQQLADVVAYDLRHSFLTESLKATKSIRTTQLLGMHSDARMTERYTLAAVDPLLEEAAAVLAALPFGKASNPVPTSATEGPRETPRKPDIQKAADRRKGPGHKRSKR